MEAPVIDIQTAKFILAVLILLLGIGFLALMFHFGLKVFGTPPEQHSLLHLVFDVAFRNPPQLPVSNQLGVAFEQYLEKRNDFWEYYGQVAIAVLITVVLTDLLLMGAISGEAGLPLLSAVVSFAIAKSRGGASPISGRNGHDNPTQV